MSSRSGVPANCWRLDTDRVPVWTLGRRPALDALRAGAVLAVIGFHYGESRVPFRGGFFGVDMFFVLSGFLITAILTAEHAKTGTMSFGRFYLRRALRLLPALAIFLAVVGIWSVAFSGAAQENLREISAAATYWANWLYAIPIGQTVANPPTLHTWSLAIEEQFYLAWPLLLLTLIKLGGRRTAAAVAFVLAVASVAERHLIHASDARINYGTDTRLAAPMAGCALALALREGLLTHRRLPRWLVIAAAVATVGIIGLSAGNSVFVRDGGYELFILAAVVLLWDIACDYSHLAWLARPVPVWIGRVSYGLYLWHWGLIVMLNHWMPWREAAAVALPLTFALTALSFQFVEEPCRRLRLSPGGRLASSQLAPVRDAA